MKKIHKQLKWRNFVGKVVMICVSITFVVVFALVPLVMFGKEESVQKFFDVVDISFIATAVSLVLLCIASCRYRKVIKSFFQNKINVILKKHGEEAKVVHINNTIVEEKYDIYISNSICNKTETDIRKEFGCLTRELKKITKNDVQLAIHHFEDGYLFTI